MIKFRIKPKIEEGIGVSLEKCLKDVKIASFLTFSWTIYTK